ncbi:hypothetical protein [Kitasatospora griseola]|uniref:hypothetical protein n=1 Tax=Kitasatospora griseola TaxID=2064 RepID=UPI00365758C8
MTVFLSLLAIAALALTAWLEWRAHRRVRPEQAHTVTAESVRYLMALREDQP